MADGSFRLRIKFHNQLLLVRVQIVNLDHQKSEIDVVTLGWRELDGD